MNKIDFYETVNLMLSEANEDSLEKGRNIYENNDVSIIKNNNVFEAIINDGAEYNVILTFKEGKVCDFDTDCRCGGPCRHLYAALLAIKDGDFLICNDVELTNADFESINLGNSDYLLNKGAELYDKDTFDLAIEYYRLSASMGNAQAMSNLGYCYLYGRSVNPNLDLAIAYFKMAANMDNIDALYKLGNIYSNDEFGVEDKELSLMYYDRARVICEAYDLDKCGFPSLYLALAKEYMEDGGFDTDIELAYEYLNIAKVGFEILIESGASCFQEHYDEVLKLIDDKCFVSITENVEE